MYKISENKRISWMEIMKKYGTLLAAIVIFFILSVVVDRFFTAYNMLMLLRQMSILTIIGFGFTFVMAAGHFDISLGIVTGLISITFSLALVTTSSFLISLLVALGIGLVIGITNAVLVAYFRLPAFISTFAVGSIAYGIKMLITKGNPIFLHKAPAIFRFIGQGAIGYIPFPVLLMIVYCALTWFVLNNTILGRRIYAVGGNPVASVYAGINIKKYSAIAFIIAGLSTSIAAVIMTSRLNSGQPLAGEEYMLDVIAIVFLSTTMFGEGEPNILGSFVGALIISMLNNGLNMLGVPYYFQNVTKGIVVIAATIVSSLLKKTN